MGERNTQPVDFDSKQVRVSITVKNVVEGHNQVAITFKNDSSFAIRSIQPLGWWMNHGKFDHRLRQGWDDFNPSGDVFRPGETRERKKRASAGLIPSIDSIEITLEDGRKFCRRFEKGQRDMRSSPVDSLLASAAKLLLSWTKERPANSDFLTTRTLPIMSHRR